MVKFAARIRTQKGGARWKMGAGGADLAKALAAVAAGEAAT
jgi:hypothetical protein